MNSLSWFLYLAEVLPALANTVGVITGALVFILSLVAFFRTVAIADGSGLKLEARKVEYRSIWGFWGKTVTPS